MSEYQLTVHPFVMGGEKDAANKVLEEASEAREAAQRVRECESWHMSNAVDASGNTAYDYATRRLADELADCIQACCNLAARYDIDLSAAMERCEERNRERGRYE